MKSTQLNSRRKFIGAMALGVTSSTLTLLTSPVYAALPSFNNQEVNNASNWFKNIKGKHRIVYDGSTPHNGFPIIWTWTYYLSNNETGIKDQDITAVCVLRHSAIPFAFESRIWKKYNFGKVFNIIDNTTGKPALRNPYYKPKNGDFPLPIIDGIKRMQERGALFCVCNLATKVYSNEVAKQMGLNSAEVYKDWVSGILPEIKSMPSGVWALGKAQEHGCGYIFAGE